MTSPLITAAREAERAAHAAAAEATKHREQVEKEEQDKRPIADYDGVKYRLDSTADHIEWGGYSGNSWRRFVSVGFIRALASLLPRKPVEVSYTLCAKVSRKLGVSLGAAREAVELIASDLSAPVAVAAPTLGEPDHWVVRDATGHMVHFTQPEDAFAAARKWDHVLRRNAPHVVYALYPVVPDATEAPTNG